jgi:hypothetical protein
MSYQEFTEFAKFISQRSTSGTAGGTLILIVVRFLGWRLPRTLSSSMIVNVSI